MENPIIIRAHHLESIKLLYTLPRDLIIRALIELGYIKSSQDSFLDYVYKETERIFSNPRARLKISIGGLDFLCQECPIRRRDECAPENPGRAKTLFLARYEGPETDEKTVQKYKLTGQDFTAQGLRAIIQF